MVVLYVGGKEVGTLADLERVLPALAPDQTVEFRNEGGTRLGVFTPEADDPDWVKAITPEETARRMAEPGFTFEEMKARLGWE